MPSQYRRDLARLKAVIVARVSAGESLRAISADPSMPHIHTVRNWAHADPGFAAALAAARDRARPAPAFDEAVAAAFLARAQAGERINDLLKAPGAPSRAAYRRWCATQAGFAEAVLALRRRRDAAIGAHGRARRRPFDQRLADRIIVGLHKGLLLDEVLAADPELPSRPVLARWRRERPQFDRVLRMIFAAWRARRRALEPVPEVIAEEICEHIVEGGTFASYCREGGPSRTTLRRWVAKDPAFAQAVAEACEWREDWLYEQVIDIAQHTPPGPVREMNRAIGPLLRQMTRLRHRPGAAHVKRAPALPQRGREEA